MEVLFCFFILAVTFLVIFFLDEIRKIKESIYDLEDSNEDISERLHIIHCRYVSYDEFMRRLDSYAKKDKILKQYDMLQEEIRCIRCDLGGKKND